MKRSKLSGAPSLAPCARSTARREQDKYKYKYLIAIAVTLAAVLELIDTSIVNVAIPHMMGNLGATLDEISWVSTGYIIANVIVIPMSAFLSAYFGRKRYLTGSIMLFVVASFFCGASTSLGGLVFWRVVQGIGGGALLSTAQATLFEAFPPEEVGIGQAMFGVGVMVGPTIGPTLGGWIVDNYNWPWIFYINVPLGIIAALMTMAYVHDAEHQERAETRRLSGLRSAGNVRRHAAVHAREGRAVRLVRFAARHGPGDHVGHVVRPAHLARADDRRADHQLSSSEKSSARGRRQHRGGARPGAVRLDIRSADLPAEPARPDGESDRPGHSARRDRVGVHHGVRWQERQQAGRPDHGGHRLGHVLRRDVDAVAHDAGERPARRPSGP